MQQPTQIFLNDYQAPAFQVESVELFFDIYDEHTLVRNQAKYRRLKPGPLELDGMNLELVSVAMDGKPFSNYKVEGERLVIAQTPDTFALTIETKIFPAKNTALEGLYKAGRHFVTQCEAQGFRKITYFMDRPDVMTSYAVTLEADRAKFPILLSNGDRIGTEDAGSGRHRVNWRDPHKKPCYLFALFAGDLGCLRDSFTTVSGRKVNLEIYAEQEKLERCHHAMASLKLAMKWDEDTYGREYDLNDYMIVAIDDFNAGAMENKGLNIFNSRLVLADPQTATDTDYQAIESVVAHEYFHNWTGNRVTLRDWFQLSLKEGLTVFRDQEFSADQSDREVHRIGDVASLRERQFPEDAGPNAHPVRPESCYSVDNFFTMTIYEKGAELIRMMQTTVGRKGFRKGMDLYFERHDGQAVTTEDFAAAIADANGADFSQLKRWYSQAGTPRVQVEEVWKEDAGVYQLRFTQSCSPTPGQPTKQPFQIPIRIGLLGPDGQDLPLNNPRIRANSDGLPLFELKETSEILEFTGLEHKPVASLLRDFSAPVTLSFPRAEEELYFLMGHDSDGFNRWEAAQTAGGRILSHLMRQNRAHETLSVNPRYVNAWTRSLDAGMDPAYTARLLSLPTDAALLLEERVFHPASALLAREYLLQTFAHHAVEKLHAIYQKWHGVDADKTDSKTAGHRWLKNFALTLLARHRDHTGLAWAQFSEARNMTDSVSALATLLDTEHPHREEALEIFHTRWKNDPLVLNKWFALQSSANLPDVFPRVKQLFQHPSFNVQNPNNVYSLLWAFGRNLTRFHSENSEIYSYYVDRLIEIDRQNPQVAARLCTVFNIMAKLPEDRQKQAREEIGRALKENLSKNSREILQPMISQ